MNALPLFLAVFVACAVEAVEAVTIVLAAGTTRGWRSACPASVAARRRPGGDHRGARARR